MNRLTALALLGVLALSCGGARGGGGTFSCSEGATQACACSGGGMGTSTCGSDGTFGACACDDASAPPMDAAMDVASDLAPDRAPTPDMMSCSADLRTDPMNCGACGRRCASTEACMAGVCQQRPMGMCPSQCRTSADCNPCNTPGDQGNYCCISNLCLYMSGACPTPTDGGTGPTPTGDVPTDLGDLGPLG